MDTALFNGRTIMKDVILNRFTLFLLMVISVSASAQTVYDARRQLMNSIVTGTCGAMAIMGGEIAQANAQGMRQAAVKIRLGKIPDANGQPYENTPDVLNLLYATVDRVYAQDARTPDEGQVIARQLCTQYMLLNMGDQ